MNIHVASACARLRAHVRVQSCTCPPDGLCIAPDPIAYAKVSGADSIAWRTPAMVMSIAHSSIDYCFYFKEGQTSLYIEKQKMGSVESGNRKHKRNALINCIRHTKNAQDVT